MPRMMFDLQKEIDAIVNAGELFEERLRIYIISHLKQVTTDNPDISVIIRDGYFDIGDIVDGEHINIYVYVEEDGISMEVIKMGEVAARLESGTERYAKYLSMVQPLIDTYSSFIQWDGADFIANLKPEN